VSFFKKKKKTASKFLNGSVEQNTIDPFFCHCRLCVYNKFCK